MAASLADLEKLFKELVMGATPEATSVRRYWDGGNLSIDVIIPLDGEFSQHIIKISIVEEAINTYACHNDAQRVKTDACLTRFIYKQFQAFFADHDQRRQIGDGRTEWKITDANLNA